MPLNSRQRQERKGSFPYYGAQGIIDHIDGYIFDGRYILVAEDGENLNSKKRCIRPAVDGHSRNRYPGRHLHGRKQSIESVELGRPHGQAHDGQRRICCDRTRQMGGFPGNSDNDTKTFVSGCSRKRLRSVRRAVSRQYTHFKWHTVRPQHFQCLLNNGQVAGAVPYTHLRAHETPEHLVCRLLLEQQQARRATA